MNHRTLRDAVWSMPIQGVAKVVAVRLVEHWPRIMPSIAGLAEAVGFSERAVRYALEELESLKVIRVVRVKGRRSEYEFLSAAGEAIVIPEMPAIETLAPAAAFGGDGPRHVVPTTPAPAAYPPRHQLPTKQTREADKKAGGRQRRAALSHFVPSEWQPKDAHREKSKGAPPGHFDRELEKFRMWEFKTPRSDWDRAFHNWLTSANERVGMNGRKPVVEDDGEWA